MRLRVFEDLDLTPVFSEEPVEWLRIEEREWYTILLGNPAGLQCCERIPLRNPERVRTCSRPLDHIGKHVDGRVGYAWD